MHEIQKMKKKIGKLAKYTVVDSNQQTRHLFYRYDTLRTMYLYRPYTQFGTAWCTRDAHIDKTSQSNWSSGTWT